MVGQAVPDDVRRRIERDFAGETWFEATRLIDSLVLSPRVLRSLLVLAQGSILELQRYARCAEQDWRDVVFWAEYEDHDAAEPRRVRNLEQPLGDPEAPE